jgi:CRISPR type I-E-associated protein CasA/Cse1
MDDPLTPNRVRPLGYLDYLTWQNRRVLFVPEEPHNGPIVREMTMAPALLLDSQVLDPMTHYRAHKKRGWLPLVFTENRALWRDSAALFRLHDDGCRPPLTFRWLAELVVDEAALDKAQTRRYLALGMSSVPGRAKANFYRSERMPLPLAYLKEEMLVEALQVAIDAAEGTARQLWGAARTLATYVLSPDAEEGRKPDPKDLDNLTTQWAIEQRYWPHLELPFRRMMESLPQDSAAALESWRQTLWRTAWDALDQVTGNLEHDPYKLKAVVRARDQLAAGLAKALPRA